MAFLFWDASGLAKRYTEEIGHEAADAIFDHAGSHRMATTAWGYLETSSILLRRYNQGTIDTAIFQASNSLLQIEVLYGSQFVLLSIDAAMVVGSLLLMHRHNLNATDAAILTTLTQFRSLPDAPPVVMIASDKRLLRASTAEGFAILNPEETAASDIPAFLAEH